MPQDHLAAEKNKAFFASNDRYAADVAEMATYANIRRAIDLAITGKRRLLDVGNGGVFDYDTNLVGSVVGVDLFLDESAPLDLPANVQLRQGDALSLDEEDASYDAVMHVFVLHHLVSHDVRGTIENVRRAIAESQRVLVPGEELLIVESCVSDRAFAVEKRLFAALRLIAGTSLFKHPPTLQLPPTMIETLLREQFGHVQAERIPVGRLILQFGHRWPTLLTPARPYLFIAR